MAEFAEIDQTQPGIEMPGDFAGLDEIPSHILVWDKNNRLIEGDFRLDPETGSAVDESALIAQNVSLGNRAIVCADTRISAARIEDGVTIRDKVRISGNVTVREGATVGRKSILRGCLIGAGVKIGSRCEINGGTVVEADTIIYARQHFPPGSTITPNTPQRNPAQPMRYHS